ncbi:MAG: hypothetical protein AB7O28_25635 [Vicinamibacterales bacterium]
MSSRFTPAVAVLVAALVAVPALQAQHLPSAAQADALRFYPDDPIARDDDMRDIPPVAPHDLSKSYDFVIETFRGSAESFGPALNVNTLGEVPDSSWFTNRLGQHDLTIEEVVRGPDRVEGPADGPWIVTGRPEAGITPKFTIRDARGDTYLIKLDPAVATELPSSVEIISTKILHAVGYHVPEDYLVTFRRERLQASPTATTRTSSGGTRRLRASDLDRWLADTPHGPDGTMRAVASRYVPGRVVGQFRYTGRRSDDPNDLYPHERRRELRGLRVFAAWLHHDDARSLNSIDTYVEEDGRRYLRHYLQDFGSNLGSGSTSAQQPRGGYEYLIEGGRIVKGLLALGLYQPAWTHARYPATPSIGNVEAEFFEPWKWKTEYPQPAFDQMDDADAFWAARIVSRFTDDMLRAIVATGRLSDPAAARYLTDVLIARRDKVVAYWLTRTTPIDEVAVTTGPGGVRMRFANAAVRTGVASPATGYDIRWAAFDNRTGQLTAVGPSVRVVEPDVTVPEAAWGPPDGSGARYAAAAVSVSHPQYPHWVRPVAVTLRARSGVIAVVGIERPTGGRDAHR